MAGNANFRASGVSYASNDKQMAAFDRLPASVRAALANSVFDWAAYPIRKWFEAGRYNAKELVKKISEWDRNQIAKDRARVWGLLDDNTGGQRRVVRKRRAT